MQRVAGLVGLKSKQVERVFVLQYFLKGQWSHEGSRESLRLSEPGRILMDFDGLLMDLLWMFAVLSFVFAYVYRFLLFIAEFR